MYVLSFTELCWVCYTNITWLYKNYCNVFLIDIMCQIPSKMHIFKHPEYLKRTKYKQVFIKTSVQTWKFLNFLYFYINSSKNDWQDRKEYAYPNAIPLYFHCFSLWIIDVASSHLSRNQDTYTIVLQFCMFVNCAA